MSMSSFTKQQYEEYPINADFSANMTDGESIVSQSVIAVDRDGLDVSTAVLDQATVANNGASLVSVKVRAGSLAGSLYTITFRCLTSTGNRWELDVGMRVA
jgi:hypothetical protein